MVLPEELHPGCGPVRPLSTFQDVRAVHPLESTYLVRGPGRKVRFTGALREWREARHLSQKDVAERTAGIDGPAIDHSTVARAEAGNGVAHRTVRLLLTVVLDDLKNDREPEPCDGGGSPPSVPSMRRVSAPGPRVVNDYDI